MMHKEQSSRPPSLHPLSHEVQCLFNRWNWEIWKVVHPFFSLNKYKKTIFSRTQHIHKCISLLFSPNWPTWWRVVRLYRNNLGPIFPPIILALENVLINTDNPDFEKKIYVFLSLYTCTKASISNVYVWFFYVKLTPHWHCRPCSSCHTGNLIKVCMYVCVLVRL